MESVSTMVSREHAHSLDAPEYRLLSGCCFLNVLN